MEIMKKTLFTLALVLALPLSLSAQGDPSGITTYALPSTTVTLEVEAVREVFFAGPYAAYAKKYLGMDVRQKDGTSAYITSVALIPYVEADQSKRYSVPFGASASVLALSAQGLVSLGPDVTSSEVRWRFPAPQKADFNTKGVTSALTTETRTLYKTVQTDTSFSRVAVQQDVIVEKTMEKRAQEAAEIILKARKEKFNITIGDTDATFSGEALGSAIAELTRVEEEYLTMFTGYTVKETQHRWFDITPSASDRSRVYTAFRISDSMGLVPADSYEGRPYFLEFEASEVPESSDADAKATGKASLLNYRIPSVCSVRLTEGGTPLLTARIPVYQFGRESTVPARIAR